jgi:hypothetical protein
MENISAYGSQFVLRASTTFPIGLPISQLADDTDPFDIPEITLADKSKGVNGDLIIWATANPIEITLAVIPGSADDQNLSILAQANNPASGGTLANDVITLTGIYPDNSTIVCSKGGITAATVGKSIASAGRMKTKVYKFAFEQITETPAIPTSVVL